MRSLNLLLHRVGGSLFPSRGFTASRQLVCMRPCLCAVAACVFLASSAGADSVQQARHRELRNCFKVNKPQALARRTLGFFQSFARGADRPISHTSVTGRRQPSAAARQVDARLPFTWSVAAAGRQANSFVREKKFVRSASLQSRGGFVEIESKFKEKSRTPEERHENPRISTPTTTTLARFAASLVGLPPLLVELMNRFHLKEWVFN